jgi:hypothetical protein
MRSFSLIHYIGKSIPNMGAEWERTRPLLADEKTAMPGKIFATITRCEEYITTTCKLTTRFYGDRPLIIKEEYSE